MRLRLAFWFLLMSCVIALGLGNNGVPPFFGSRGVKDAGGLADVVASPRFVWSLRASSIAKAGTKAVNACNVADVTCADLNTDSFTGDLVIPTIGGSSCSVVACTIKTIYLQETNGTACTGNCDMVQATIANRAQLIVNCTPNGHACARCTIAGSTSYETAGTAPVIAQQISVSAAGKLTTNSAAINGFWGGNSNIAPLVYFTNNNATIYAGTNASIAQTNNTWHAFESVISGASSAAQIDGSFTGSLNANTNPLPAQRMFACASFFGSGADLDFGEVGVWGTYSFTGGDFTALNSNQTAYW